TQRTQHLLSSTILLLSLRTGITTPAGLPSPYEPASRASVKRVKPLDVRPRAFSALASGLHVSPAIDGRGPLSRYAASLT
ncbi:hypothetical protein OF83DRAFT_1138937, partial [Amylostereum chailletii]